MKDFSEKPAEAAARLAIALHGLGIFDQTDRGRELRIFKCARQAGHRLRMRDARRHFENVLRQIIDPVELAAPAGDENAFADVVDERFFLELRA